MDKNTKGEKMAIRLVQLKNSAAAPGFVSTKVMGEVVREKNGVEMKNCVMVYELLSQFRDGTVEIKTSYLANSGVSNGTLKIKEEDISITREVDEKDEFMVGYSDALERLRLSKIDLLKPTTSPTRPQPLGRA